MQKGTVLSLKSTKIIDFIAKNNILVILVVMLIAGITCGTFTVGKFEILKNYSENYIAQFIADRTNASFITIAFNSFMASMLMLLAVFASGTSMLGVVLIPVLSVLRGMLYGSVAATLYASYSLKGIAFNAVMVIPTSIIFIIALLLASRESIKFSLIIVKISLPRSPAVNLYQDFKNYCGRYIFICLVALLSALTDAVLSRSFLSDFTL